MNYKKAEERLGHVFFATGNHPELGRLNCAVALAIDFVSVEDDKVPENIVFLILNPVTSWPAQDLDFRSKIFPFVLTAYDISLAGDYDYDDRICLLTFGEEDGERIGKFNIYYDEAASDKILEIGADQALERGLLFYGEHQVSALKVNEYIRRGFLDSAEFDPDLIIKDFPDFDYDEVMHVAALQKATAEFFKQNFDSFDL